MSCARRGVRAVLDLHGQLPHEAARRVSAPPRILAQCSRTGKHLRWRAGGAQLPPGLLAEDGYDAGVKTPVAVPDRWAVPSGKVWVTSKLQVTRSPCTLCLDAVSVSV
jgi:hypothetical protein